MGMTTYGCDQENEKRENFKYVDPDKYKISNTIHICLGKVHE